MWIQKRLWIKAICVVDELDISLETTHNWWPKEEEDGCGTLHSQRTVVNRPRVNKEGGRWAAASDATIPTVAWLMCVSSCTLAKCCIRCIVSA